MAERPQKTDRKRLDLLLLDEPRDLPANVVLIHRNQDLAPTADPLVDLGHPTLRHDVGRTRLLLKIQLDLADAAMDIDRLLETTGCQQGDTAPAMLGDGIRDHGRAVHEALAVGH